MKKCGGCGSELVENDEKNELECRNPDCPVLSFAIAERCENVDGKRVCVPEYVKVCFVKITSEDGEREVIGLLDGTKEEVRKQPMVLYDLDTELDELERRLTLTKIAMDDLSWVDEVKKW